MKPRNFFYCLILLINTLLFGGRIITKEDIADLHYVFSPAISSDGDNIAYVLSVPREDDENPGPRHSEIWVKRINDQKPVRFTSTSYDSYAPQWSWNGKNITFLSRRNKISKLTQLYSIPIDGGEANLFLEHAENPQRAKPRFSSLFVVLLAKPCFQTTSLPLCDVLCLHDPFGKWCLTFDD